MAKRAGRSRTRLLALEPRVLFDGALADTSAAVAKPVDSHAADALDISRFALPAAVEAPAATPAPTEWLIVDSRVPDAAQLVANARPGINVLLLDPERDGLEQITQALAKAGQTVAALHIVSSGAPGSITLGSAVLDEAQLDRRAAELIGMQQWLTVDADLVLYGSDAATTAVGESFVRDLAQLTGAEVASYPELSAGAAGQRSVEAAPEVQRPAAVEAPAALPASNEIIFLDVRVADYQQLLEQVNRPGARVVLLDAERDAIDQIAAFLDGFSGVDAVHIISHGTEGNLIIGGRSYTADSLTSEHDTSMARIGRALSADGDILLYGCEIGQGSAGERLIETVASMTGADVAASANKTGATEFGGDWTLESHTGTIDALALFDLAQPQWSHLLATNIDLGGGTLSFNNANRTLVSGVDKAVGAVYRYANVATISGTQIDAYVTITSIVGATLTTVDQDAPTGYVPPVNLRTGLATTAVDPFAPEISTTAAGGHVDFTFRFKDNLGNDLTLFNFASNSLDIDGAGTPGAYQEFDEYGGFESYTLNNPTDLKVSAGVINTDQIRFTGSNAYNGLVVNDVGRVQANFNAVTTLTISFGATASTGGLRQYGDLFAAVGFNNPTTVYAPVVNLLTTTNNTPTITGTLGGTQTSLAVGESFKVTFQGTDYTTANGLTINADGTWSLPVNSLLPAGTYSVRAVKTLASGLALPDQTSGELVVNNAPVLNDTPLTLPAFEDAPAPVGAVGDLLSTFTGGISDQDPSAATGLAIIGADESNGTWYYTTDGGASWIALNAFNGTVSATNALPLADNASTRLYFRPSANYNLDIPAALTVRGWDQTRGIAGVKLDPGATGSFTAYSVATDVIDVHVFPVNDAPVRTAGATNNLTVAENSAFTSLGLGAVTYGPGDPVYEAGQTFTYIVTSVPAATLATIYLADGTTVVTAGTAYTLAELRGMQVRPAGTTNGAASFSYNVTDSGGTANGGVDTLAQTLTITVTAVNNPPVVATSAGTTAFTEGANVTSTPVVIDGSIAVSDADNATLASATVRITGGYQNGQDLLAFTNVSATTMGNITWAWNAVTGTLTLTSAGSTATVDQWRAALGSVTYTNSNEAPNTAPRTITFVANDGAASSTAVTRTVSVAAVNDPPVNSLPGNQSVATSTTLTFNNTAPNPRPLQVTDADSTPVTVTLNVGAGTINVGPVTGGTVTGNGSGTVVLTGTPAAINTALNAMTYAAPAAAQTVTLTMTSSDGTASDVDTILIAVGTAPGTIDLDTGSAGINYATTYAEGAPLVNLDGTNASLAGGTANDSRIAPAPTPCGSAGSAASCRGSRPATASARAPWCCRRRWRRRCPSNRRSSPNSACSPCAPGTAGGWWTCPPTSRPGAGSARASCWGGWSTRARARSGPGCPRRRCGDWPSATTWHSSRASWNGRSCAARWCASIRPGRASCRINCSRAGMAGTWSPPRTRRANGCCARRSTRSTCKVSTCRPRAWCRAAAWSSRPASGAPSRPPAANCSRCWCGKAASSPGRGRKKPKVRQMAQLKLVTVSYI